MKTCSRRHFIHASATASVCAALAPAGRAIEPLMRTGTPRLRLSLAAYSFRDYFTDGTRKATNPPPADKVLDMFKFIDYCADHGSAAELTSYYFPKDASSDYLRQVKRHAFLRNVSVSGTSVGNDFTVPAGPKRDEQIALAKKWVDHAAILGAPYLRVFAGSASKYRQEGIKKLCIEALEECADYAGAKGVMLGMENHGGIDAAETLEILHAVQSRWFALNLDVGNFQTDDPYGDLAKCAPYAINCHWKSEMKKRDQKDAEPADFARLIKMLRNANYQGYLALEHETKEDPWIAVPRILNQTRELLHA
ncbi:MAG: sugar phosphate isomerase/epimerase [Verrucomicrobia bacterium]|nr:sugar phosphate isomerase/epimerase [Verrucomicrobiota bacterium]